MSNSNNDSPEKLILGAEYDVDLREDLLRALKKLNASIRSQNHYVTGSQDLEIAVFSIDNETIVMESETIIGLSVSDPDKIVNKILSILKLKMQ